MFKFLGYLLLIINLIIVVALFTSILTFSILFYILVASAILFFVFIFSAFNTIKEFDFIKKQRDEMLHEKIVEHLEIRKKQNQEGVFYTILNQDGHRVRVHSSEYQEYLDLLEKGIKIGIIDSEVANTLEFKRLMKNLKSAAHGI